MKFAIITHVLHGNVDGRYFAYAPYVREMNIWAKYVDKLIIVAPLTLKNKTSISFNYEKDEIKFTPINELSAIGFKSKLNAIIYIPKIVFAIYRAMKEADHIHLRCPGNIGLLGCMVQLFFPNKPKTAKYAGNWDPNTTQPLSYKIQKWILNNTFLSKNITVLVYGEWNGQSKNIKPFFTATYSEVDKISVESKTLQNGLKFIFVGTLSEGKNPLYAINIVEEISKRHSNISLNIFGNGQLSPELEKYIETNKLENVVFLNGNQSLDIIKKAYIDSHFVILPSKSEGWPKVLAEGMFWKCLPIATPVSCVLNMLDNGNRGVLLTMNLIDDVAKIYELIENDQLYNKKAQSAMHWSRNYTSDFFEKEIKKLFLK
jgi:glycosyltransferase involved in cell wall biosynthesis